MNRGSLNSVAFHLVRVCVCVCVTFSCYPTFLARSPDDKQNRSVAIGIREIETESWHRVQRINPICRFVLIADSRVSSAAN